MTPFNGTAKPKDPNPQPARQGTLPPPGTFDPRLFSSTPWPVIQQYNSAQANRRPTCTRFFYAFAIATLVWILCTMFLHSFLSMVNYHPWRGPGSYPVPPHVALENCVAYSDWSSHPTSQSSQSLPGFPFTTAATFNLPLSAEALLLLSRGPRFTGSVEIVTSPQQEPNVAAVEVIVSYFRKDIRDQVKLCRVLRKDGAMGVGIFTPQWPFKRNGPADMLHFATKVILPEVPSDSSPLLIKKFETDVVNTVHRVGDLNKKVLFQSLLLKGSNGRIDVESVHADQGIIGTSNAAIRGIFNTSTTLLLATSNGKVDADIGLSSIEASKPNVTLTTSNAALTSRISLISDIALGGSFGAVATTSNGRLNVNFPAASPYSLLTFIGTTSNAQAAVSLNPSYEGSFFLQTSNRKPVIKQDKSVIDPTGRNRKRSLNIMEIGKKLVTGDVYWDDATEQDDLKPAGMVSLHSSNAQVELDL